MTAAEQIKRKDPVRGTLLDEVHALDDALRAFIERVAESPADLSDVAMMLPDHWTNRLVVCGMISARRGRIEALRTFGAYAR